METSTDKRPFTRTPYFALPLALNAGQVCAGCAHFKPINIMPSAPGRCAFKPGIIGRDVSACPIWKGQFKITTRKENGGIRVRRIEQRP